MDRKRIAVVPESERAARATLFDALEGTLPVRFTATLADAEAAFVLPTGDADALPAHMPRLVALAEEGPAPAPASLGMREAPAGPVFELSGAAPLDVRLRGRRLRDAAAAGREGFSTHHGDAILAARGAQVAWVSAHAPDGTRDRVAVAPAELGAGEALRDRLRDGRFLALAALVHFARDVCAPTGWRPPPLRACFLFDDPNLHRLSYGHLRYRELVRQADAHGYHVTFATVPLDAWFADPRAARLFRERSDRLSLVVHGNDHTYRELDRPAGAQERRALLAQALHRVAAFERRTRVPVGRIMVAPHGVCSHDMARDLVPLGFEALCISRPYPWLARPPHPWLTRPRDSSPLVGWEPASIVDNGLPVLLRRALSEPVEDLALRAFIDQPLIVYGHHDDMERGIERLGELAAVINGFGPVEWTSPAAIAARTVTTRIEGDALRVRMHTRRVHVDVPAGITHLVVETPALEPQHATATITCGAEPAAAPGQPIAAPTTPAPVEVRLVHAAATDAVTVRRRGPRPWPIARRILGESRDRLLPLYRRARA